MKKIYLLLLALVAVFVGCKKDMDVAFSTFEIEDEKFVPSYTTIDLTCKVRCTATINELYLQYDTVADFSTYEEVQLEFNKRKDVYSVSVEGLLDNTTYYVRYFAENSYSSAISDKVGKFKTLKPVKPTIEVKSVKALLDKTATVKIALKSNGGASILRMGVCWSTEEMPTIQDKFIEVKNNQLSIDLSGLTPNTTYYVRAYAENKMGSTYSTSMSFITLALPEVKTGEIENVLSVSAVVNGEALFDGNDSTVIYGFCWGEVSKPTIEGNYIQVAKESFSYKLSNLNPETTYYVRAFAKNKIGVVYGEEISFRTLISDDFYDYVCEGDAYYVGFGFRLNIADIKGDTILSRVDNDSVITLYLEYIPTIVVDTTVFVPEGDFYEFGELTLNKPGTYSQVFISAMGCDSVVNLTITNKEYVDLGLSVKWATFNVGATKPEEYGDYFAWGEVETKTTYDWSTYKYCKGTIATMTKYCTKSSYGNNGFTDNKTVLEPSDDAATVNWGGEWRMPTDAEMQELVDLCQWIWATQNGVKGYKVTGPNENSIFLPAAGYMCDSDLNGEGSGGGYWSSSLNTGSPYFASSVYFDSGGVYRYNGYNRYYGPSVRPVCP